MTEIPTSLLTESRDRYLTYALSVISSRALPDVRDGLKPVQRRILFAMRNNLRLTPDHAPRKSAAIVGEVLGHYHPHGDLACYEAMVRMAQDFSLRYPLVDGHGNFGSLDGDSPAAYRYTEARLQPLALEVIGEIDEETVPFRPNFDARVEEPIVLPSRVPNLLINGASGIAVGMATSIPPHNLKEVCKALLELSKNPAIPDAKLLQCVKAPDFPSGCLILNTKKELAEIYSKGRGMIRMRGEWELEDSARGKQAIIITAIPYSVNKAQLVERIASLIIDRKLPQLVDVRDESTSDIRIVLELAPQADPQAAVAFLCKHTPFEHNFAVNFTALVPTGDGSSTRPEQLSLRQCLKAFLDFREEVVERRLAFERRKLQERIHILEGFAAIYDALDEAIKIVRQSSGRQDAAERLRKRFSLSEPQSFAIVDMRIYQLSKTSIQEIREELKTKKARVTEIDKILKDKEKVRGIVRDEIEAESQKFGDRRRCKLVQSQDEIELEFKEEDYVVEEAVYAIVTRDGWVKRIRQGNELSGTRLREGDAILAAFPVTTREIVAFVTNLGSLFTLKVSEFPASGGYGSPVQKLLKFRDGETIIESFVLKPDPKDTKAGSLEGLPSYVILDPKQRYLLVTAQGMGYSCTLDDLGETKRNGKKIFKLHEGDTLARIAPLPDATLFVTKNGYTLVLKKDEIPERNSPASGVTLMKVREGDAVMAIVPWSAKGRFELILDDERSREMSGKEFAVGHRGLQGQKVIRKGMVIRCGRLES